MKSNIIKYIFIIFVIILMGFAIYKIKIEENKKEIPTQTKQKEEQIIKEISLGVAGFDTINPILSNNKYIQEISKIIYDPLLEIDENYKIKNCLVKDWAKTSSTTYLLKLKEDIYWSDGEKFTSEDVAYTIDILKNIPSIYAKNVQFIVNVNKIDNYTIQLTLAHEIPFFEYNLNFPIISKTYFNGEDFSTTQKNNSPIGTGKYKISQNNNGEIILIKNDKYTREELMLEKIIIKKFSNVGELYNAFKLGKIDLITSTNTNISNYIGTIGYNIQEVSGREFDFLALNTQNNILGSKEVRMAISYAINKENIVATLFNNKYKILNYPLDYGHWLKGESSADYSYNPNRSKQILQENGWIYKNNVWQKTENYKTKTIKLKLVVQASNQTRIKVSELIKNNLEEIGIKVTLVKASDNQYQSYIQNKNYDMILTGIIESMSPNLDIFFGASNLANYNNEEIMTITNEVKNITKEELLIEKYNKIRQIYDEERPYIGLYSSYYTIISNWNLKGKIVANWYNVYMDINNWYKN